MASLDAARNHVMAYDDITIGGHARALNGIVQGNVTFQGDVIHNNHSPDSSTVGVRCLQSLAFPDMTLRREGIVPKTDATCEWVYTDLQYLEWVKESGILWVKGKAGSGKSTLMHSIVQDADQSSAPNLLVISFFFHRRGTPLQHTAIGLFRCLLHQILRRDSRILLEFVKESRFEERCETEGNAGERWHWTEASLRENFKKTLTLCSQRQPVQLYIDALDESGEATAKDLMAYLEQLREKIGPRLSICISCRPYPDVIWNYDYCVVVEDCNQADIATYLDAKFSKAKGWGTQEDADEIKSLLLSRASGLFQWIVLVTYRTLQLRKESVSFILNEIQMLPRELGDLYEDMLGQLSVNDQMLALPLMRWVTCAVRPLTLTELRDAVSIDPNVPLLSSNDCRLSPHWCCRREELSARLLRLSLGLVEIVDRGGSRDPTAEFSHESVQDFMLERGLAYLEKRKTTMCDAEWIGQQHHSILISCIRLMGATDVLGMGSGSHDAIPLWDYVVCCWMDHAVIAEASGISLAGLIQLTQWPSCEIWDHWAKKTWDHWARYFRPGGFRHEPNNKTTLQHVAAEYGLNSVLRKMIPMFQGSHRGVLFHFKGRAGWQSQGIDAQTPEGLTPLSMAAANGKADTVKILLETRKVDVNSKNILGETPLAMAAKRGFTAVAEQLLGVRNVDTNSKDEEGRTPLMLAVGGSHEATVQYLLKSGKVAINETDVAGDTALAKAVKAQEFAIVKLLVDTYKADANVKNREGKTPLSHAIYNADESLMHLLLGLDGITMDVNVGFLAERPLAFSARWGYVAIMRLLLDYGDVHIDSENEDGQTPLMLAVQHGHEEVIRFLLSTTQVDVNAKDYSGSTPLMLAICGRRYDVVKLLLADSRVRIDAKGEGCMMSWVLAARCANEAMTKLFIETGRVDVASRDAETDRTILLWAAKLGWNNVVKLLLANSQVDFEAKDRRGMTPLMLAARFGHEEITNLLLKSGRADVASRDLLWNRTSLMWAARCGQEDVIALLLADSKSEVEAKDRYGQTALMLAARAGHRTATKLLLDSGKANTICRDAKNNTALMLAVGRGHQSVASLLERHMSSSP